MAERTGFTAAELAAMKLPGLSCAENKVRARAKVEGWPATIMPREGRRPAYAIYPLATLPEWLRNAIAAHASSASSPPAPATVEAKPEHAAIALERFRIVTAVVELVERGELVSAAIDATRVHHPARTVRGWYDLVRREPRHEWMRILLPKWRNPKEPDACHPDAWDAFVRDYMRGSKSSARQCYIRMLEVAEARGWSPIPGYDALRRRLRTISVTTHILYREGEEALARTYPAQQRDRTGMTSNQAWNADGHRCDVRVRWPDGTISRPHLVGYQDVMSGAVLSWRLDRSENSDLIRLAFADAVTANEYGPPDRLYVDNGLAFASKENTGGAHGRYRGKIRPEDPTGVITQFCEVRFVKPYHGQSKPIERFWRDFCEEVAKHPAFEGAYLGSNPTKRPHNYDNGRIIELADFEAIVRKEIQRHNERSGRRSATAKGRSLWTTYLDGLREREPRVIADDQKRLLWLASEKVKTTSTSGDFTLAQNRYWCAALNAHMGKFVIARFDPDHLHDGVHVYLAIGGAYLGFADCIEKKGFEDRQAGRDHNRARADHVRTKKELARLENKMPLEDLQRLYRDPAGTNSTPIEAPPASVVHATFGAPRLSKAAAVMAEDASHRRRREENDEDEISNLFSGAFDDLFKKSVND